jgi:hypothetical protein
MTNSILFLYNQIHDANITTAEGAAAAATQTGFHNEHAVTRETATDFRLS